MLNSCRLATKANQSAEGKQARFTDQLRYSRHLQCSAEPGRRYRSSALAILVTRVSHPLESGCVLIQADKKPDFVAEIAQTLQIPGKQP